MKAHLLGPLGASLTGLLMLSCAVVDEAPLRLFARRAPGAAGAAAPAPRLSAVRPGAAPGATRSCDCYATGDLNQSGVVTAADAQMAFTVVLGLLEPSPAQVCAADCDGSGVITAADAQLVFGVTLGLATCPAGLPDGACCESDSACAAGRCWNGLCCAAGDCCATAADCPAGYSADPRCDDPDNCQGTAVVATCVAGVCGSGAVADDTPCGPESAMLDCGPYVDVACNGQAEQQPLQCADSCLDAAQCDPGVPCVAGACERPCRFRVAFGATAPDPDGATWQTAYPEVQAAVDAAALLVEAGAPRCEVWVARGAYAPAAADLPALALRSQVDVYGGFAGTEEALEDRDWQANATVLTGLGQAPHVVLGADDALLDGFVITGGAASGTPYPDNCGAGLLSLQAAPRIQNCSFVGNAAARFGGGLFVTGGAPQLTNVTFYGNTAESGAGLYSLNAAPSLSAVTFSNNVASGSGGGAYSELGTPLFEDCTFSGNEAAAGGGLFSSGGAPRLRHVMFVGNAAGSGAGLFSLDAGVAAFSTTFSHNVASGSGGGVYAALGAPMFVACAFEGNEAAGGGGLFGSASSPNLVGCAFRENRADQGGAVAAGMGSAPTLTNCAFAFNYATDRGGALLSNASSPNVTNCSFSQNVALTAGGALYSDSSDTAFPWVTNSILWGDDPEEIAGTGLPTVVRYSDVQGGYPGQAVLDAEPWFVDICVGDLHLADVSPCRDRADGHMAPPSDADGHARCDDPNAPNEGFGDPAYADLGAYEFQHPDCEPARAASAAALPVGRYPGPPPGPAWAGLNQKCR